MPQLVNRLALEPEEDHLENAPEHVGATDEPQKPSSIAFCWALDMKQQRYNSKFAGAR